MWVCRVEYVIFFIMMLVYIKFYFWEDILMEIEKYIFNFINRFLKKRKRRRKKKFLV